MPDCSLALAAPGCSLVGVRPGTCLPVGARLHRGKRLSAICLAQQRAAAAAEGHPQGGKGPCWLGGGIAWGGGLM